MKLFRSMIPSILKEERPAESNTLLRNVHRHHQNDPEKVIDEVITCLLSGFFPTGECLISVEVDLL